MLRPRTVFPCVATAALLAAAPAQAGTYTVQSGDTLTAIAARYHTTLEKLARANGLEPYGILLIGTHLKVPSHSAPPARATTHAAQVRTGHYRVRWGDTLTGIAAAHHTTLQRLAQLNGIEPYAVLVTGTDLRVPLHGAPVHHARQHPRAHHRRHHRHHRLHHHRSHHHRAASAVWTVRSAIDHWSRHYGVNRHLTRALAWMESGWQPGVVSSVGAWGVMQVTPATWSWVELVLIGHPVAHTADGNIRIGTAYLAHLLQVYGGNQRLALAAYYQGPGAVDAHGVLPVSEPYVADILALASRM